MKGRRLLSSLRARIVAVVALLFFAGVVVVTLPVSYLLFGDMRELVFKQQLTAARYIARDVDGKLTLRLESLRKVAENMPHELFADPVRMQAWLEDRRAIHTLFPTGMLVVPADGGPSLADVPHMQTRPKSFNDRDWFVGALRTRQPYISKPLIARATNEPALVIAVPVYGGERLLGLLIGVTPMACPGFLDLIVGTQPGERGSYQLVSPRDRLFVLASDAKDAVTALPPTGQDWLLDQVLGGFRGVGEIDNGKASELAAAVDVPHTGWVLISRQPTDAAFEPVMHALRNAVTITLLLALPILFLLLASLGRMLLPIGTLAEDIHAMADGRRPFLPLQADSAAEVAVVAASFNRLQARLVAQERRLADIAHRDALTGLPNRLSISEQLDAELLRQHGAGGLALLFLDLDGFKQVNDAHGHQVGDALLALIAKRLRSCVRDVDTVARLGGDEFLIMLSRVSAPLEVAERAAQQCLKALGEPFSIQHVLLHIGASIGVAVNDEHATVSAAQLIRRADVAMYRAKQSGRNCCVVFSEDMAKAVVHEETGK
jgi:diguanylate cyclase